MEAFMFLDWRARTVSLMTGRWINFDCEEYEEERPLRLWAGFQKWGAFMVLVFLVSFSCALFVLDSGPMKRSTLVLVLVLSLGHLVFMALARSWVKASDPRELSEWYDGHMKNYAWAAGFATVLLAFQ
jgi:hypothetical protein